MHTCWKSASRTGREKEEGSEVEEEDSPFQDPSTSFLGDLPPITYVEANPTSEENSRLTIESCRRQLNWKTTLERRNVTEASERTCKFAFTAQSAFIAGVLLCMPATHRVYYVLCYGLQVMQNSTPVFAASQMMRHLTRIPPGHRCGGVSAKGCEEPFKGGENSETQDGKLKGKCADEDFDYSLCCVSDDSLSYTESEHDYSWLGGGDHPIDSLADENNSFTSSSTSGDGSDDDGGIGSMCHDGDFSASTLEPRDYTRLMAKYRDGPSTGIVIDSGIGSSGGIQSGRVVAHTLTLDFTERHLAEAAMTTISEQLAVVTVLVLWHLKIRMVVFRSAVVAIACLKRAHSPQTKFSRVQTLMCPQLM